jgi:hypothetical protein
MKSAKKRMSCIVFRKPGFSGWHAAASTRGRKFRGSGWQAQEATAEIIHVSFIFHFTKAQEWRTEFQKPLCGSTGKQESW